jgi:flagellar hook assembly protein FlgD
MKPSQVSLKIYNIKGQLIKTLIDDFREPGSHKTNWEGTNFFNQPVASGLYFYQLKSEDKIITKKMLLLK